MKYKDIMQSIDNLSEKARDTTKIGLKMKAYRAYNQMTQEDLARKLEVSRIQIARWEAGKHRPSRLAMRVLKENGIL